MATRTTHPKPFVTSASKMPGKISLKLGNEMALHRLWKLLALALLATLHPISAIGSELSIDDRPYKRAEITFGPREPASLICQLASWPLLVDGALCDAAKSMALLTFRDEDLDAISLQSLLFAAGVTDAQIRARRIIGETYNEVFTGLELAIAASSAEASHIGMALVPERKHSETRRPSAILLLADRKIHIKPFSAKIAPDTKLRIEGRKNSSVHSMTAYIGMDNESVRILPVDSSFNEFVVMTEALAPGRHMLEILVDAGQGPEISLLAPVLVQGENQKGTQQSVQYAFAGDITAAIHQEIAEHRHNLGLERAQRNPVLDRLAIQRAESISRLRRPVHRPAPNQDIASRLAEQGYPFAWAAENLSTGPNAEQAFFGIIQSPAHRLLIEHNRAKHIGVGIIEEKDRVWMAVLLAEPMQVFPRAPTSTSSRIVQNKLLFEAEDAIRAARRSINRNLALRDPELDELAGQLATYLAENDLTSDTHKQERVRSLAVKAFPRAWDVSIDIVVGGRPQDIANASSVVNDECFRIGVGLASSSSKRFGGQRLWITALCLHMSGF